MRPPDRPPSTAAGALRVWNRERETILVERARPARTFFARFRGLMGVAALPPGEGLLIEGDNAIHTCFMRFPIDVAFLDADRRVVHLIPRLRPWRVSPIVWRAKAVLELPAGTLERSGTRLGDRLTLSAGEARAGGSARDSGHAPIPRPLPEGHQAGRFS